MTEPAMNFKVFILTKTAVDFNNSVCFALSQHAEPKVSILPFSIVPCRDILPLLLQHANLLFKPDALIFSSLANILPSWHLNWPHLFDPVSLVPWYFIFAFPKKCWNEFKIVLPKTHTNTSDQSTIIYSIMSSANQLRHTSMMAFVLFETSAAFIIKTGQALQGWSECLFICLLSFSGIPHC